MEVIIVSRNNYKIDFINQFMKVLKYANMENEDKRKVYEIVMKMPNKTTKQKRRFTKLYGLNIDDLQKSTLTEIAKLEGCTLTAIRDSVLGIKTSLWKIPEKDFEMLQSIYRKYQDN